MVLTKDLLRVSRAGGYRLQFTEPDDDALAARVLSVYRDHVGERRETLEDAMTALEREAADFKLVRGFAKLLDREATFATQAPLDPGRVRTAAFEAAEAVGVVTPSERTEAITRAADSLDVAPAAVTDSLFADRESEQVLVALETDYTPESLRRQYDLSLAQTALFDAVEVRVQSSDPRAVISAVKRLRLMYEIRHSDAGREVVVTGPDALFTRSRRYGTRFARLLRTVAATETWQLDATIDDRGTERQLALDESDLVVPGTEPVAAPSFDSSVESDFYARFASLDLDWEIGREPAPLAAGEHVVIPDFAFDWQHSAFRVFFEIMGFWTPEYIEKKLSRFADLEADAFIVAYDESLGVGEQLSELGHRAVPYTDTVRVKDVRDALRPYERDLQADSAASLPDEFIPEADVIALADVAAEYGVSTSAVDAVDFPDHDRVGRTLIRPSILTDLSSRIEPGMQYAAVETLLKEHDIADASALLATLGYKVEWDGLAGGIVRRKE